MRRLFWTALGAFSACALSVSLLPAELILYAAAASALLSLTGLLLKNRVGKCVLTLFLSAAAAFSWFSIYTSLFIESSSALAGCEKHVALRVTTFPEIHESFTRMEARLIDEGMPGKKMLLYCYDDSADALCPGDEIKATVKFLEAGRRYGEESDFYYSQGFFVRGYIKGGIENSGRWRHSWLYFPAHIAQAVKQQTSLCFSEDTAPLMKALLTGDKSDYYGDDDLYSAMRIAGFSHIVAVSGMHVAFLLGVVSILTGKRRSTAFIGIPLIVVFMSMVGFTPSVVRAGIMQIILLAAPLLRRENDPLTSLSLALLVLLAVNPYTVCSAGFLLSFSSMAGVITAAPGIYRWFLYDENDRYRFSGKVLGRVAAFSAAIVSSSIGASVFSVPIAAIMFGSIPLYSMLTNLLCLHAMSAAFSLGYPVCVLGMIWPACGRALGWCLEWLPRYTEWMVKHIAGLPHALVYTRGNVGAVWLVLVYAVFAAFYLAKGNERFRPLRPICISITAFALMTIYNVGAGDAGMEICALDVGQGQSVAIRTEEASVLIDCGGGATDGNAGDAAADYFMSKGRGTLDLVILTHLHSDHANGVSRLISRMNVKRIVLASDCGDSVYYDIIGSKCASRGVELIYMDETSDITVGDLDFTVYAPTGGTNVNERGLVVSGEWDGFGFMVMGDADINTETVLTRRYELADVELLVVGHHGSRYSTGDALLDELSPETAFISVGSNTYGHPTQEVLDRLAERDIEVLRTDIDGNISIQIGNDYGKE